MDVLIKPVEHSKEYRNKNAPIFTDNVSSFILLDNDLNIVRHRQKEVESINDDGTLNYLIVEKDVIYSASMIHNFIKTHTFVKMWTKDDLDKEKNKLRDLLAEAEKRGFEKGRSSKVGFNK